MKTKKSTKKQKMIDKELLRTQLHFVGLEKEKMIYAGITSKNEKITCKVYGDCDSDYPTLITLSLWDLVKTAESVRIRGR